MIVVALLDFLDAHSVLHSLRPSLFCVSITPVVNFYSRITLSLKVEGYPEVRWEEELKGMLEIESPKSKEV